MSNSNFAKPKTKEVINSKTKLSVWFKLKRWFFGMIKEFKRIKWAGKKEVLEQMGIILLFWAFLALLFFLVDLLFLKTGILA